MALSASTAAAVPPAPCNNAPQITDAVANDGHHSPTNVTSAWWTEGAGHLQAVIKVFAGTPVAEHDEADVPAAGYAFVYTANGQTRYVRAVLPIGGRHEFDHGTYSGVGGFANEGATTGLVESSASGTGGTVTIDVPGIAAGTKLTGAFVITYDGVTNGGVFTEVDHAPGGEAWTDPARGADYVVGSCGATPPPGATPTPTAPGPGTETAITSVQLSAPKRVTGRKTVTVTGKVLPARANVDVTLSRHGKATAKSTAKTAADGTFKLRVVVGETTRLRASVGGTASGELTVTAYSKVKIKVRNRADGSAVVTGTVDPKLPGRVLWLRANAIKESARATVRNGKFTLRLKSPRPGRYQAVYIPTGERAERSTSNTGVIR
ncbi:hypothetical protein OJ997_00225 [Solirubrobacter phytolaccae]|uniref:Uncharacterized protein n=1 Tax=Solirubrobacter phytolaccae TaxID=1404360 RepID=A0A9X3N2S7_9ACTN|nr:hypothetical protein [Solirubrobacter phytolaccae]MDA0178703.1 hypothetical protein [Solirubrobacter phytolaccae]